MCSDIPWITKYRPTKLSHIVGLTEIKILFEKIIKNREIPHLILYGPPGTGKTSIVEAFLKEYYVGYKISDYALILNASDERGIGTVRNVIKPFAQQKVNIGTNSPGLKFIILDEADTLTNEAQTALRRTMEIYGITTKFILMCNYIYPIIDPLQSRCARFYFRPLKNVDLFQQLKFIADNEKLKISDGAINLILEITKGDARRSITILQSTKYIQMIDTHEINEKNIKNITSVMTISDITEDWNMLFEDICISDIIVLVKKILFKGYSINNLLSVILTLIIKEKRLTTLEKCRSFQYLACIERRILDGCTEFIQILAMYTFINKIKGESLKLDFITDIF